MVEFLSSLTQAGLFRVVHIILMFLLAILVAEMIFCVVLALRFRVEKLSGFRERFLIYYEISAERNAVSWKESKNNWFLWMSVLIGKIKTGYMPLQSFQSKSETNTIIDLAKNNLRVVGNNAVYVLRNTGRFAMLFLSTPFYLMFSACSIFERCFRFLLGPVVFFCFWLLAKIKIFLIYHFEGKTLTVDSINTDVTCTIDVLYRKPVIRIILRNPQDCPDSLQKDNINHFTTTLKRILPSQHYIKFKTEVIYPNDESALKVELPLTHSYLRAAYAKLNYIKSREAPL